MRSRIKIVGKFNKKKKKIKGFFERKTHFIGRKTDKYVKNEANTLVEKFLASFVVYSIMFCYQQPNKTGKDFLSFYFLSWQDVGRSSLKSRIFLGG